MRTVREVLRACVAAAVVALALAVGAAAEPPTEVQASAYPWVQLPAQVGQAVDVAATSYRWVEPASVYLTVQVAAPTTSYPWVQVPARSGGVVPALRVESTSYRWVQPPVAPTTQ